MYNFKQGGIKMAKIIGKKIKWLTPTDTSVKAHVVYLVKEAQTLDYLSPKVEVAMPTVELTLPASFDMSTEGNYKIGISAKDSAGNESDMATVIRPFDFTPPAMPVGLEVVDL